MPTVSGGFGPLSPTSIKGVEERLGIIFPIDYKGFLLTTNGGSPSPNCFVVPDRGEALVDFLYGVRHERKVADLECEQITASRYDPLPKGMLAIGHDPGGNTLLMQTEGQEEGQILYWDRGGLWTELDGTNTFPVARTFTEFMKSLKGIP